VIVEQLLIATRSDGKLRELRELFRRAGIEVIDLNDAGIPVSPDEENVENADTFEGNALAKARHFAGLVSGAVVADDSGLEVIALGGRPGVYSKRWSGRTDLSGLELDVANNARLIAELAGTSDRRAQYVCVAAYVHGPSAIVARGAATGVILDRPRGTEGFGYDPYFLSDDLGKTFAEATLSEKEAVSHRGRAFRALIAQLSRR
jgi:XTP/dITP diphosphohydrolase